MAKGESIEALLSPSLRVSRPVAACQRCRSAKIKCDGRLPACTACERSGKASSCSGANDDFARGKERSYVAALEAASARLQKKLADAKSSNTSSNAVTSPASNDTRGARPGPSPISRRTVSGARKKEASDVDDLVSDFGFLSVNATSRDFRGFADVMSFARLLLSVSTTKPLPKDKQSSLPPRYTAMPLIQRYLENVFVILPFFSETEFMTSMSSVYQESGRQATPFDHYCFRMVLAIAAATNSKVKGDENNQIAHQHVSSALDYAEMVLHPGSMTGLQAILFLFQYSLLDPEHFNSWYLIGMATRVMVDLGLHQELPPESKASKQLLDTRRRLFYCAYAMDRKISTALERPFSFTDDSASNVLLPSSSSTNSSSSSRSNSQLFSRSLEPSLFLFDIRRVQSAFYQTSTCSSRHEWSSATSTQYLTSILSDIESWYTTIPSNVLEKHRTYFLSESLYSQALAMSPSEHIPLKNMSDPSKTHLLQCAAEYANLMQSMIDDSSGHAFLTYTDILRVQYIGKQLLAVMWSSLDLLTSGTQTTMSGELTFASPLERCTRAINCLRQILDILEYGRKRWGLSNARERFEQESAVLLGRLRNRQQELSAYSIPAVVSSTNQTMPQLPPYAPNMMPEMGMPASTLFDTQYSINPMGSYRRPGLDTSPPPQFLRASSSDASSPDTFSNLPAGTLPRRSYEFLGGRGGR
jgi:Fungal specific transcription factor domain/Fungal Zn(2)-Cys(6) binuclear cluster domain